jgi:hypothetical protein
MLTTDEAFRKFKGRLELNDREQADAGRRHSQVRAFIRSEFDIQNDFLTGSYRRWTKTKPLKDIDIFFVLGSGEADYREKHPSAVIDAFYKALVKKYGEGALKKQARSVNIDFGVRPDADDKTDFKVLSIDAVPAFAKGDDYEIPDTDTGSWIETNPKLHAEKATAAHQAYSSEWKGLVRMAKYWNNNARHGERPVKPSFLIEVMALECVNGAWGGRFDYEVQALFSTLADRVGDTWADPAGLGPPVSTGMDAARKVRARELLLAASRDATGAIDLARRGRNGEALQAWRKLFGPRFPLS